MLIFRILCGEWIEPLWLCMQAAGQVCMAVFLPTLILGHFVVSSENSQDSTFKRCLCEFNLWLSFDLVAAVLYTIQCYIGPRYNGSRLYINTREQYWME